MTGERTFEEVCFVGCRQSQPLEDGIAAYQPYVDTNNNWKMRIANTLFRLVNAKVAPVAAARAGLALCAPELMEVILACDPDFVLLDVRWGNYLKALLDTELPGRVFASADLPTAAGIAALQRGSRGQSQYRPANPQWIEGHQAVDRELSRPDRTPTSSSSSWTTVRPRTCGRWCLNSATPVYVSCGSRRIWVFRGLEYRLCAGGG